MSGDTPEPLDRLLADWAASRRADDDHLRRLSEQIVAAVQAAPHIADDDAQLPVPASRPGLHSSGSSWNATLILGGSGALLALLVVGGCLLYYSLHPDRGSGHSQPTVAGASADEQGQPTRSLQSPPSASLGSAALATKRRLLAETNALFDNQLAWIADGQRDVALEIGEPAAVSGSQFLLIRLVVAKRASAADPWATVWQADVIARNELIVEVAPQQLAGSALALWTHVLDDNEVVVEMDLTLDGQTAWQSSSNSVLRAGQPTPVASATRDGAEHCLFQTVMPLEAS